MNAERPETNGPVKLQKTSRLSPCLGKGTRFTPAVSHANRVKEFSPQPRLRLSGRAALQRRVKQRIQNRASAPDRHRVPRPSRAFCGYSLPLAKSKGDDRKSRLIPSSVVPMLRTSRSMGQPGRDGAKVGQPPVTGDNEGPAPCSAIAFAQQQTACHPDRSPSPSDSEVEGPAVF